MNNGKMDDKDRVIADLKWRLLMVAKLSAGLFKDSFNAGHAKVIRDAVLTDNGISMNTPP